MRLTREESSRCKLTDDEIEQIIRIRGKGLSYANIAKLFNVSAPTIYLHCNPEKSYQYNKSKWENRKTEGYYDDKEKYDKLLEAQKKTRLKKREIIPGYSEWENKEANKRYMYHILEKRES